MTSCETWMTQMKPEVPLKKLICTTWLLGTDILSIVFLSLWHEKQMGHIAITYDDGTWWA